MEKIKVGQVCILTTHAGATVLVATTGVDEDGKYSVALLHDLSPSLVTGLYVSGIFREVLYPICSARELYNALLNYEKVARVIISTRKVQEDSAKHAFMAVKSACISVEYNGELVRVAGDKHQYFEDESKVIGIVSYIRDSLGNFFDQEMPEETVDGAQEEESNVADSNYIGWLCGLHQYGKGLNNMALCIVTNSRSKDYHTVVLLCDGKYGSLGSYISWNKTEHLTPIIKAQQFYDHVNTLKDGADIYLFEDNTNIGITTHYPESNIDTGYKYRKMCSVKQFSDIMYFLRDNENIVGKEEAAKHKAPVPTTKPKQVLELPYDLGTKVYRVVDKGTIHVMVLTSYEYNGGELFVLLMNINGLKTAPIPITQFGKTMFTSLSDVPL